MITLLLAATLSVPPGQVTKSHTLIDSIDWAISHQQTLPVTERTLYRYIYFPPWANAQWHTQMAFTLNTVVSQSPIVQRPPVEFNGFLMPIYLPNFIPNKQNLPKAIFFWDTLAGREPYLHVPKIVSKSEKIVIASNALELYRKGTTEKLLLLQELNNSSALVYRADWLIYTLGQPEIYNKFRWNHILSQRRENESDQDVIMRVLLGLREAESKRVGGDSRWIGSSRVAGQRDRRIDEYQNPIGWWFETHDVADNDFDDASEVIINLLAFQDRAREHIFPLRNGLPGYLLTGGILANPGQIANSVPENIANDYQIPNPHVKILEVPHSCWRCHAAMGEAGLINPGESIVPSLLRSNVDIFDDVADLKKGTVENVQRLVQVYEGNRFQTNLRRARENYREAFARLFYQRPIPKDPANFVLTQNARIYDDYIYKKVTPRQALLELGFNTSFKHFEKRRHTLALFQSIIQQPVVSEDLRMTLIMKGFNIQRSRWEKLYQPFLTRLKQ